jgi:hypothetical protein
MGSALRIAFVGLLFLVAGCGGDSPTKPHSAPRTSKSTVFDHIQTFEIGHDAYDNTDTDFIATHYDVFVGGGVQVPRIYDTNPDIKLLSYITVRANSPESFGAGCSLDDFCAEDFAADHGYDVEDFFLHYKQDVCFDWSFPDGGLQTVAVSGWNPDWQSGDPPASASQKSESRVWGRWQPDQRWANIASPAWQHWRNEYIADTMQKGGRDFDGVLLDGVVRIPSVLDWMLFDKTIEYWGETVDNSFVMIDDHYAYAPILRDYLEQEFGESKIIVGNAEASYYLSTEPVNPSRLMEKFEWLLVENGVRYDWYVSSGTCSYDIQFQQILDVRDLAESGKKILFGGKDNEDSERGRIFILATFYLINGPNLYFCDHQTGINWFEAIAFDIGEPLGEASLRASGTNSNPATGTYYLMEREYTNALVLVKYRESSSSFLYSGSESTHDLGGSYEPLDDEGKLGTAVTQITLRNNEAAILIPQ